MKPSLPFVTSKGMNGFDIASAHLYFVVPGIETGFNDTNLDFRSVVISMFRLSKIMICVLTLKRNIRHS